MRVLILGGAGMLGHKLWQVSKENFETWVTLRAIVPELRSQPWFDESRVIDGFRAEDLGKLQPVIDEVRPEVIVNCIGLVKQLAECQDPVRAITINALFPHQLAQICEPRRISIVQISTDCIFSGRRGDYSEDDIPDPVDLYGQSKSLGELGAPHLTIRTSIIGHELRSAHGLVDWFLSQPGPTVRGYTRAIFSGLPTIELATRIGQLLTMQPRPQGLLHIASRPISKYDLLLLLARHYNKPVEIEPDSRVVVDRSLSCLRYQRIAPPVPDWDAMIAQMASDGRSSELWRKQHG